ncbi:MAG: LysM peptidoglycan-binding domain-containing protein [Dialister invisus]|uniref:LysM peptidoglycan-binding domain-containing protein n=1 Tax=Dialister invisus TaxID=218538 RepID=A0A930BAX5_9FIRM|nr:LysM peptidoglycan-binding domain-containing protein [Dialister invisus]
MLKFITAFMIIVGIAGYAVQQEPPSISYAVNISKGETLWDVCDRVSGGRENLQELVWRTAKENNIKDPGTLQPGQEIIVKVKEIQNVRAEDTSR